MTERMSAKQYREQFVERQSVPSARIIITNMPPSANGLRKSFIKEGKVIIVKSDGYADWRKAAVSEIASQAVGKVEGPYRLSIVAQRHWRSKRARDIDNIIKPISDALVKAGIVQDDSLAECVTARWADDLQGHAAVIDVEVCQ
ncbi:RusA family crossover junction endodeoxyribonuclease [Rhizobium leguminosarum]|uniref:RusA family crossover junction endodeoxyribonuclease n=1 Tax=Rhizobium leguminosarum TaxID=384 RepID=UPI0010321D87|nr:RusA family crossover junction endodeoxyribonuclease [Rhizobium leguminosarum]TAV89292.1 RusA family crossover junction endodeoxyribonuclease [Rhizobium leguminosarum]TAV93872.1 RusA family crossover junction endodeoxyribonuclease [Rhizobium leguminosarum]TAW34949.1 RusA family crossover junction endodeoxyribonuclease [Rhizobium leguminosarum]